MLQAIERLWSRQKMRKSMAVLEARCTNLVFGNISESAFTVKHNVTFAPQTKKPGSPCGDPGFAFTASA